MIESGCAPLGERNIELRIDDFQRIVQQSLDYTNKYDPDDRKIHIETRKFDYTFTGSESVIPGTTDRIPRWLSDVVPVRFTTNSVMLTPQSIMMLNSVYGRFIDSEKREFIWSYQEPNLFLDRQGRFEVHACYDHPSIPIKETIEGEERVVDIDYPTITTRRSTFLLLVRGKFMQGIGRYRRAFTLNDLPIAMDAPDLVTEGQECEERAKKEFIEDASRFYLAFQ